MEPAPMETVSKIFLMEFVVDDLRLWKLPLDVIESDPARLVFTYLDSVQVEIDKHEFDMAGQNEGKNCLFTSDRRPSIETPIKVLVLKKALEEELIKIGEGRIHIEETFSNLFRVSLPEPKKEDETVEQVPDSPSTISDPVEFPITAVHKAWYPLIETPAEPKDTDTAAGAPEPPAPDTADAVSSPKEPLQIGVVLLRLRITCFGSNMVAPLQYDRKKKSKCVPVMCNTNSPPRCSQLFLPVGASATNKNMNMMDNDCTSEDPCAKLPYVCPPSERRAKKREHRNRMNKKRQLEQECCLNINPCARKRPPLCACNPDGIYLNKNTLNGEKMDAGKEEFLLVPPASTMDFGIPKPIFDEYRTAIDENELIVRVTKNTRTVCQVSNHPDANFKQCPEGQGGFETEKCPESNQLSRFNYPKQYAMTVRDDGNDMMVCMPTKNGKYINSCGIPLIRGNLKYPPRFETSYRLPQCGDVNQTYRPVISDAQNWCMKCEANKETDLFGKSAMCPDGIEVCKKMSPNPNYDVFVLKLAGPKEGDLNPSNDQIELELRTPKSPTAPAIQETIEVQTYEEDFEEPYVAGGTAKGGKKDGKKDGKGKKDKDAEDQDDKKKDKKDKKGKKK